MARVRWSMRRAASNCSLAICSAMFWLFFEQSVDVRLGGVQVLLQRLEIGGDRVALAGEPLDVFLRRATSCLAASSCSCAWANASSTSFRSRVVASI